MKRAAFLSLSILLASIYAPATTPATTSIGANLTLIDAPAAWSRGFTGKGIVVAVLDTGADMTHPELAERWRGGSNSWFDPYGEHPAAPVDLNGHGTQILGVMIGGDGSGTSIGVAPDAKWIAAKIFDDHGRADTGAIHAALRWVLDPDGNPATNDAPKVVNSSWSFAGAVCDPEFDVDLRALRAAGILPVFAAGTGGPISPADSAEAFPVGALAEDGITLYFDSAHGPSTCHGESIYPRVTAPGEYIVTTDLSGGYATLDGTSLAAAQVSGALAVLLSADPALTAAEQATIIQETATDLGEPGPDDEFGYGRINVAAALNFVLRPNLTLIMLICLGVVLIGLGVWQWQR